MKLQWVGAYYSYILYRREAIATCVGDPQIRVWELYIRNMPEVLPIPYTTLNEQQVDYKKAIDQKVISIFRRPQYWRIITEGLVDPGPQETDCPICKLPEWVGCGCE